MVRTKLTTIKEDLGEFLRAMKNADKELTYACLIPVYKGKIDSPLILQVNADWVNDMDCSEAISLVVDILFKSTTPELRNKLFRVDIYDENGEWHCTSPEYILTGEMPEVY